MSRNWPRSVGAPQYSSVELIEKLVAFDTTSCKSNLQLIQFVQAYLDSYGVQSTLVFDQTNSKANLYATIGPQDRSGVMLSGHTDVVPVDGQDWATDPFVLTDKNNALFGRGTADMKSFIAVVLAAVPQFVTSNLSIPVHLAFSYDEEIGCVGVRRLIELMDGLPVRPAMCIVGEPTNMGVVNSHKGKLAYRVSVTGRDAHSSLPTIGVNAVDYAAELIVFIRKLAKDISLGGPFADGFDVNYTTLHTGNVRGGGVLNIVPNACEFEFEIRNIPDHDPHSILEQILSYANNALVPEMKQVDEQCDIDFIELSGYPGMFTPGTEKVVDFVKCLTGESDTRKISFGTEGGLFTECLGIPTVVCGPGSIEQAHKPNEFIENSQVALMEAMLVRLVDELRE